MHFGLLDLLAKIKHFMSLIILVFLISVPLYASNLITLSEFRKGSIHLNGAEKIRYLNKIPFNLHVQHPEECIEFSKEALKIALKFRNTKGQAFALRNLGRSYRYLKEYNKAISYYQEALKIFRELKNQNQISICLGSIGISHLGKMEGKIALKYFQESLTIARSIGDKRKMAYLYGIMGGTHRSENNTQHALDCYENAIKISEEICDRKKVADLYIKIGNAYQHDAKFSKALRYYNKSKNIYLHLKNSKGIGLAYYWIGNIYMEINLDDKALGSYLKCLRIADDIDTWHKIYTIHNIGMIYNEKIKDFDKALKYFFMALDLCMQKKDIYGQAASLLSLGEVYYNKMDTANAIKYLVKTLSLANDNQNHYFAAKSQWILGKIFLDSGQFKKSLLYLKSASMAWNKDTYLKDCILTQLTISKVYMKLKDYEKSSIYLSKILKQAKELKLPDVLRDVYRSLSHLYFAKKNFKESLNYYKLFHKIDTEIFNEKSQKNLQGLQIKFETEQKEKENEVLRQKEQINLLKIKSARILRDALIIGIGLVFIILVLLFRRYLNLFAFWKTQRVVGEFRLVEKLGFGSYGSVWKSQSKNDKSQVAAVKILNEDMLDESTARRFRHEGTVTEGLNHKNIVNILTKGEYQVKEGGELKDKLFIAMEYLNGMTLDQKLKENGKLSIEEGCHIAAQITDALSYIHGKGIIHRDLKPGNIMVVEQEGDENFVKLLDFGLAKSTLLSKMTQTGMVIGTTRYISPEQALGQKITTASDIFSLGLILYEMVAGKHPFPADTYPNETIMVKAIIEDPPDQPREINKQIPKDLNTLIMSMLEKKPEKRPTAEEVLESLRQMTQ